MDLDGTGGEVVQPKAVTYILRKRKNDLPYLFLIFQVGNAGNAVTDRLDWGDKILVHDPGGIPTVCVAP